MVKAGLAPYSAPLAATRSASKYLADTFKIADEFGAVAVGNGQTFAAERKSSGGRSKSLETCRSDGSRKVAVRKRH
jgi:hypothetical protein